MISQKYLLKRTVPLVIQCAEAHRKPRWLPVAKSKMYRIPKRPEVSEEEKLELLRIHNNYKTQMRAIRWFYHEDMMKEKLTLESASSEMSQKLETEDWQRCIEINEKWNKQIALEREKRLKAEELKNEEYALNRMVAKDRKWNEMMEKASQEIKLQKELSTKFITPETLEEAIEQALANPVDYNFAIDLKGNQFVGRDTSITYSKDGEKTKASV